MVCDSLGWGGDLRRGSTLLLNVRGWRRLAEDTDVWRRTMEEARASWWLWRHWRNTAFDWFTIGSSENCYRLRDLALPFRFSQLSREHYESGRCLPCNMHLQCTDVVPDIGIYRRLERCHFAGPLLHEVHFNALKAVVYNKTNTLLYYLWHYWHKRITWHIYIYIYIYSLCISYVFKFVNGCKINQSLLKFSLPPLCKWGLRSSGMLGSVDS